MRVLFLVSGLGLGNSTRCHAIMQELHREGAEVTVLTSGNGVWYFKDRAEVARVVAVDPLFYGASDGRISIAGTLRSLPQLARIARRNARLIGEVVRDVRPDVAVVDSMYNFRALRRQGVPIAAVNNADVVRLNYHRFRDRPRSICGQFYAVEENDLRFHRWVPDLVVSPALEKDTPCLSAHCVRTGPIVRQGYGPEPTYGPVSRVVVMLSGSGFGGAVAFRREFPSLQIDVIGRDAPARERESSGVTYHGRVRDNLDLLKKADLAVVNGGFSAVSELFQMRKPLVVLPVPRHAEQWLNARTIVELGVGLMSSHEKLEVALAVALSRIDVFREAYARIAPELDAARQAADAIRSLVSGRAM